MLAELAFALGLHEFGFHVGAGLGADAYFTWSWGNGSRPSAKLLAEPKKASAETARTEAETRFDFMMNFL
jgi:hypothetical protein